MDKLLLDPQRCREEGPPLLERVQELYYRYGLAQSSFYEVFLHETTDLEAQYVMTCLCVQPGVPELLEREGLASREWCENVALLLRGMRMMNYAPTTVDLFMSVCVVAAVWLYQSPPPRGALKKFSNIPITHSDEDGVLEESSDDDDDLEVLPV